MKLSKTDTVPDGAARAAEQYFAKPRFQSVKTVKLFRKNRKKVLASAWDADGQHVTTAVIQKKT